MEDKFLINVIAKRYNISRSTLIYYDNIGVLSPTHYDKNNYRYYGREDMEKLEVILTLKESGLPLKLIKKFIKSPSHSSSIDILKKQKDNISKKIKELEKLEEILEKRIQNFEEYEKIEIYDGIRIRKYPELKFYREKIGSRIENSLEISKKQLKEKLDNNLKTYGTFMSKYSLSISLEDNSRDNYGNYTYVMSSFKGSVEGVEVLELEESDYIAVLFYGPLNKNLIMKNMEKLIREVQEKEYKINGDCYVVPLIDSWATLEEEEYINEMLIPIKKN